MTTTTPATAAELRAQLADLEANELAEQDRQANVIQEAIAARSRKTYDAARTMESELETIGTARYEEAVAAATIGDLNGAYTGFVGYLGATAARRRARSDAQSAAHIIRREPHLHSDLAYRQQPFSDFLESNLHKAVEANASITIAPYFETEIVDYDTATAYLKGK